MKHYQVMVELCIDFEAENMQVAMYAVNKMEITPKFPEYTKAKLGRIEDEIGEIVEVLDVSERRY